MKTRQERIIVRIMPDNSIRLYDSFKKTPISEWQIQSGNGISDTVTTTGMGKVWVKDERVLHGCNER